MNEYIFHIEFDSGRTLQEQIREYLVNLILSGGLSSNDPLPSSRNLSQMLGVSRNTIILIYESLVDSGYIESRSRKGYFVSDNFQKPEVLESQKLGDSVYLPDWSSRFIRQSSNKRNIVKPSNWQDFEYPFIYGQIQKDVFPIDLWRDSVRKSMSGHWNKYWINDMVDSDDPMLIDQIRTRILPRRGIYAEPQEILFTLGTQNSLYLLANLLCNNRSNVTIEDPGFRDAVNIFSLFDSNIHYQPVDSSGILVDDNLKQSDYLYITPSSQVPTGAELSEERRHALLKMADENDFIIIEDDYDSEISTRENPLPSLKALDKSNRVIYIGSMSKSISPGLRMGYMVADEQLIKEVRSLRKLMYRHPPMNNQRYLALFLSLGHYDAYLKKLRVIYSKKESVMIESIDKYLPESFAGDHSRKGVTSFWLTANENVCTEELSQEAAKNSILIEPGAVHFSTPNPPSHLFRLGFSAIETNKIEPGIKALSKVIDQFSK